MFLRRRHLWMLPVLTAVAAAGFAPAWLRGHPVTIAVIPETTAQQLWETEHAGAVQTAKGLKWNIYWNGPSREDDFSRQVQIVRQEIKSNVRGIVLSPDHDVVLISPAQEAIARKIPVVILGSPLGVTPGGLLTFVLNDDRQAGRIAARRAVSLLPPKSSIAILGVNPNFLSSIERAKALEETISDLRPDVGIHERRSVSASFASAEEGAEEVLREDPNTKVIVALGINEARAAFAAIFNQRLAGKVSLIACDQDLDLLHHLRNGEIDSVVAVDTYTMAVRAIQDIQRQLSGQIVSPKTVVSPILVTRDNVDSLAVQHALSMDWSVKP